MRVAETDDGAVFMLITSAVLIYPRLVYAINIVWHGVGVGTQLHDAEGCASPGEGVPHAVGPDDGVDVLDVIRDIVGVSVPADGWLMGATQNKRTEKN